MSSSVLVRLQRLPRIAVLLLGLALIAAIAWLDSATGPKLLLNVFYLLPVMFVAWVTASTVYGLLAVLATFLVGPLEAYLDGLHFYSLPVAAWNAGMRTAVFCIVLLLLAEVRKLVARLQEQSLTDELTGVANRRAFLDVAGARDRAQPTLHARALAGLPRHRRLQGRQRPLRPRGRRPRAHRARRRRPRHGALGRHRGAHRRRRVRHPHARDRRARRAAAGRASVRGLFTRGRPRRGARHLQRRPGHLRTRSRRTSRSC